MMLLFRCIRNKQFRLWYTALWCCTLSSNSLHLQAQNRISDHNDIFWMPLNLSIRLNNQWGWNGEYQWRRDNSGRSRQQDLWRTGISVKLGATQQFQLGYAWVRTHPYGDIPIASRGSFSEHRIHQQWMSFWPGQSGNPTWQQRIRLEQRWLNASGFSGPWTFMNRIRVMQRLNIPLKANRWYAYVWDEVFLGFGKNTGQNVFDQNRLAAGLGWDGWKQVKMELGIFQQILQQGRPVGGKNVFQYNTGPMQMMHRKF